jgi:hypothetical protein
MWYYKDLMNSKLKYLRIGPAFPATLIVLCLAVFSGQAGVAAAAGLNAFFDADEDRMPDNWELANGLNPYQPNAAADNDSDGFSNYDEYLAQTDPLNPDSALIAIKDTIPQHAAGITGRAGVAHTNSFGVLIESVYGVDLTDSDSIRFIVDDTVHPLYARDLGSNNVRIVKLSDDRDTRATRFWVVYDRLSETHMSDTYAFDAYVAISADIRDIKNNVLAADSVEFKIESEADVYTTVKNLPETAALDPTDPLLDGVYDTGLQVVSGPMAGARIIYNSSEPQPPMFGPIDEITAIKADDLTAVGMPINLQPHTVFETPVKVYIPVPDFTAGDDIGIYFHDGLQWHYACDPDGYVLDGGLGWMKPGSRVIFEDNESTFIGIEVHHFSGTQAVVFARFDGTAKTQTTSTNSGATVAVSCFISAAADSW